VRRRQVNRRRPILAAVLDVAVPGGRSQSDDAECGLASGPGAPAPYIASGYLLFDMIEDFKGSFGPHTEKIMADIPNYTPVQPVVQISEAAARRGRLIAGSAAVRTSASVCRPRAGPSRRTRSP
jgi:uncharacterized protein (TIGR02118 family)